MKAYAGRKNWALAAILAGSVLSAGAMADDDDSIARGERRPMERPGGYEQGRYGAGAHPNEYHPAESDAARQDINRNQDLRNLQNNAQPEGYPAYTPAPQGASTVNINTTPQNPQH